jgi:DNA-directed RNA polymerase subunit beta
VERRTAQDSGDMVVSPVDGEVTEVTGTEIVVKEKGTNKKHTFTLDKFERSNQGTCMNQKPLVRRATQVKVGDVLADGPSTDQGELALGRNLMVAFMPWNGHNFEDAIILSERLVKDDLLTSIHIEEHEIDARDTKLGPRRSPVTSPTSPRRSSPTSTRTGSSASVPRSVPGDYLVGKVTPKGETELTPEERLLRAIFGEKAREVRDTSLKVPHGEQGKVIAVKVFKRDEGFDLPPGVNELVRVYVASSARSPRATSWPAVTATRASSPRSSPRPTCRSWPTGPRSTSSCRRSACRPE